MEEFYGFLGGVTLIGIFLLGGWLISRRRRRKEKKLGEAFKATYDKFVANHSELYEKVTVPFDAEDRKTVNRYHNGIIILLLPFTAGFFALLYLSNPESLEDVLAAFCFGVILVVGYTWSFYTRRKTLAANEKTIVKGVITYKKVDTSDESNTYHLTISEKETIEVKKSDYKKFSHGDIIQVEVLGSTLNTVMKYKISLLGKLESNRL